MNTSRKKKKAAIEVFGDMSVTEIESFIDATLKKPNATAEDFEMIDAAFEELDLYQWIEQIDKIMGYTHKE